ncbi:MAG: YibE/F family protein [Lactobacillus sp.]|jgi:uncharacterized membrane protein|nr:YibE/F family protein [Lactobacillus sp.]
MKHKTVFQVIILVIVSLAAILLTRHDAFLYHDTVAQVQATKVLHRTPSEDGFKNVDHSTTQSVTLRLLNTAQKGKIIQVQNTYTDSQAVDQNYRPGQQVLISGANKKSKNIVIQGLKRDTFMVILICATISLILIIVHRRGLMAILSLIANVLLFILAIQIELLHNGKNIIPIFAILVVLFTVCTIALIFGLSQETLIASIATIVSTFASFGLFILVLHLTGEKGIHYEAVEYAVQGPKNIFLAQVMIGVLGAIMDESTDITSAMYQLKQENTDFKFLRIFKSGLNMGKQIIGPLISILFLIFMADTIPMAVLYLRNGNSIAQTFNWTIYLGVVQSLVSAIGIVLAVPLTSALAGRLLGGNHGRHN